MTGHGHAAKPAGPYTLGTFVDQLSNIVRSLDCAIDLVGFSMGALVAQGFVSSPGGCRIRSMVLLNAVHNRSPEERRAIVDRVGDVRAAGVATTVEPALQRWFTPAFVGTRPDVVESVRQRLLDNDARAYADAYEVFATADADLVDRVGGVAVPTLVATGSDDQRSTPAMTVALADALPDGRSVILPGLRHLTPLDAPDVVADLIDEFTTT
jgi:pimeloyl-ACP methyl ester carboxylesterase